MTQCDRPTHSVNPTLMERVAQHMPEKISRKMTEEEMSFKRVTMLRDDFVKVTHCSNQEERIRKKATLSRPSIFTYQLN